MRNKKLIFDLDGTLIDSAPSILSCFRNVLAEAGIQAQVPVGDYLIGPPLPLTLRTLTGIQDEKHIATLVDAFKQHYDTQGYRDSLPYAGIPEALNELKLSGFELSVATNKRILPTRLILDYLQWNDLFTSVWALDSFQPRLADKPAMLGEILKLNGIAPAETIYIGDKIEDGWAAQSNAMHFVAAHWGYGEFVDTPEHWQHLQSPTELVALLNRMEE